MPHSGTEGLPVVYVLAGDRQLSLVMMESSPTAFSELAHERNAAHVAVGYRMGISQSSPELPDRLQS